MFPPSTPPPKSGGSTTHARSLSPRASSPLHRRKSVLVPPNLNDKFTRAMTAIVAVHVGFDVTTKYLASAQVHVHTRECGCDHVDVVCPYDV
jgi:hypothetical protein